MKTQTPIKLIAITALCLSLAACKSAEEQAEERFQSALALVEEGDYARAVVELKNVFQIDGAHREARWTLAQIELNERSNAREAYSQLLRLAEQYPDDLEVRVLLSQLAFENRNFDELDRHGIAAENLAPNDPRVETIGIARQYRDAAVARDDSEMNKIAREAKIRLNESPKDIVLRNILMDAAVRDRDFIEALEHIDTLIELRPAERRVYDQRLAVIAEMGDAAETETQLLSMVDIFPEDIEIKATLLRFYLSTNRRDDAETFLRNISSPSDEDPSAFFDLIRFVAETKGDDAALVEIERAIAENPKPGPFRALRASLWYSSGDTEKAITEMEDIIASSSEDDDISGIKISLARMLFGQENEVGARRLVEEVIAEDSLNAEALKIRAQWQINGDEIDLAIADLRQALDVDPDDADAMTMLATAYSRLGSHDLARDFLSLAASASNFAPEETARYASRLINEEQYLPAEDALLSSLRLNPGNENILRLLGQVYILSGDEARARQVADTLRRGGTGSGAAIAAALEAEIVSQREGAEEALNYLAEVANSAGGGLTSQILLLRSRLAAGDIEGASALVQKLTEENPDSIELKSVAASLQAVEGNFETAEQNFREIVATNPRIARNWIELIRVLGVQNKTDEQAAALNQALEALPDDPSLLWAQASLLQANGDIDGAIAVYESLYQTDSSSLVIANNLASLLATFKNDEESIERAFVIARRLRDTEVPQFQDTYGWIVHRRGDSEEALTYLEAAAAALADDPIVQYHYGMALSGLGRTEDAIAQLQKAVSLAGTDDTREQFKIARDEIFRLQGQ